MKGKVLLSNKSILEKGVMRLGERVLTNELPSSFLFLCNTFQGMDVLKCLVK